MCKRDLFSILCFSHQTDYRVIFANKDTLWFSFLKSLDFCWISASDRTKFKKPTSMSTACDRKEIFFLHILSKPCKLVMLCMTFLHSAQRTTQNQSPKIWSLGLLPTEKSGLRKQVLKQRTCLFHTALAGEGKTSDRHCLTLKPACLPSGKSMLDTQIRMSLCLSFTWDCLLLVAEIQTSKWKKSLIAPNTASMGSSPLSAVRLCCWQQQAAPHDTGKRKMWMLYYYPFLLFLLFLFVFKGEAQLLLPSLPSPTKFLPQSWELQEPHPLWNTKVIGYCELLPFSQTVYFLCESLHVNIIF